jgi:predicted house-cleaning noncanonical NTP pyrophosphatase (MazG superfamily)
MRSTRFTPSQHKHMTKRIVDKLVRDKILAQMQAQGKKVTFRTLTDPVEKKQKLVEKFGEKYKELFEAMIRPSSDNEKVIDGLADMIEILNTVTKAWEIAPATLMERKKKKLADKGGYETMTFIQYMEE